MFDLNELCGNWDSFENYFEDLSPAMQKCWEDAENAVKQMPSPMFQNGALAFWKTACNTVTADNPVRLGGWAVSKEGDYLRIKWLDKDKNILGNCFYQADGELEKGLEGKPCLILKSDKPGAFRYVLVIRPLPDRKAVLQGGILNHLHFQFAAAIESLISDGKLALPWWYATMCAEGTLLERCNVVRALHHLPKWETLE